MGQHGAVAKGPGRCHGATWRSSKRPWKVPWGNMAQQQKALGGAMGQHGAVAKGPGRCHGATWRSSKRPWEVPWGNMAQQQKALGDVTE